jgi:putative oxidoreductase
MSTKSRHVEPSSRQGNLHARRPGRARNVVAWCLAALLALAIVTAGIPKVAGDAVMVQLFADIGAGQWLRLAVGALEIAGGVGLMVPRLRSWAALGLLLLLIGATFTNVVLLHVNTLFSVLYAVLALAVLLLRRHELADVARPLARPALRPRG